MKQTDRVAGSQSVSRQDVTKLFIQWATLLGGDKWSAVVGWLRRRGGVEQADQLTLLCFHLYRVGHGAGSHCGVRLNTDRVDGMLR